MKVPKVILVAATSILMLSLTAATASASPAYVTAERTAYMTGNQVTKIGEEVYPHYFRIKDGLGNAKTIECNIQYSGVLSPPSSSIELSPNYTACKAGGLAWAVSTNGCKWKIDSLQAGSPPTGTVGLDCSESMAQQKKAIVWVLGSCTWEIPEQSGIGVSPVMSFGSGSGRYLESSFNVTNLKYTTYAGCPNQPKTETKTNGEMKERFKLTATSESFGGGVPVGLWTK
jgi:hypothetical protein